METNDSNLGAKIVGIIFIILIPVLILHKYGNRNTIEIDSQKIDSSTQKTEIPHSISNQVTINQTAL